MLLAVGHAAVLDLEDEAAVNVQALAVSNPAVVMNGDNPALVICSQVLQVGLEGSRGLLPSRVRTRLRRAHGARLPSIPTRRSALKGRAQYPVRTPARMFGGYDLSGFFTNRCKSANGWYVACGDRSSPAESVPV